MVFFLVIVLFVFFFLALFLAKEMLKKFRFMSGFVKDTSQKICWTYEGGRTPGMYNIMLQGTDSFSVLIGFTLHIPVITYTGFDYFAYHTADKKHKVVVSVYLGKQPCEFQFLLNTTSQSTTVLVSSSIKDQKEKTDAIYPPHWWQRLGFYA